MEHVQDWNGHTEKAGPTLGHGPEVSPQRQATGRTFRPALEESRTTTKSAWTRGPGDRHLVERPTLPSIGSTINVPSKKSAMWALLDARPSAVGVTKGLAASPR